MLLHYIQNVVINLLIENFPSKSCSLNKHAKFHLYGLINYMISVHNVTIF